MPPAGSNGRANSKRWSRPNRALRIVIPLTVALVAVLLYMAFGSLVDVLIVLSNVVALACGGVWALLLTHTNFSVSAAVGFISIFGVAVMDAILQVSSFHRARLEGKPLDEAVVHGSRLRLRPIMMTALTAIFGLLPAAFSTRIGAQSPASVGDRGNRRHDYGATLESLPDARALQRVPPPAAQRRSCRLGQCRVIAHLSRLSRAPTVQSGPKAGCITNTGGLTPT